MDDIVYFLGLMLAMGVILVSIMVYVDICKDEIIKKIDELSEKTK